jgi:uncharacterized protein (TIGR02099 family)
MPQVLRKLFKALGVCVAVLVIIAALGVGAFRIVVAELPSYQGQIQAWAEDVLGLGVGFSRLDARWGLRGPELTFYDASVARRDEAGEPIIRAAAVTFGLSPRTLLLERSIAVERVVLERTELTLERGIDGALHLKGAPAVGRAGQSLAIEDLPSVEVVLSDSTIRYSDLARGLAWTFGDVRIRLEHAANRVLLEARGTPPADLGQRIDVSIEGDLAADGDAASNRWLVVAELGGVELAPIAASFPDVAQLPRGGSGEIAVWLQLDGTALRQATAQLAIDDFEFPGAVAGAPSYDELSVTAEWAAEESGWRLALTDLTVSRAGRPWPQSVNLALSVGTDGGAIGTVDLKSNFLRLEDLEPVFAAVPEVEQAALWEAFEPRGDVTNLSLRATRSGDELDYAATADFRGVGIVARQNLPGVSGVSGSLRADSRSGRIVLATREGTFDWPEMFRAPIEIGELSGTMVWRHGRTGIRLVSDNLNLNNRDIRTRSNLELVIPNDGSAPRLDLESRLYGFDTTRTHDYLPVGKLPPPVVRWLDRAIIAGRVPEAEVTFFGPITAFPFDNGEGQFHARFSVEDGTLAYVDGWPVANDIRGEVEFVNAALSAHGSGRVMRSDVARINGGLADMRDAVLTVDGDVDVPLGELLDFLRSVPVTARRLGPDLSRLQAMAGVGDVAVNLSLPLKNVGGYTLDADIDMHDGELRIDGLDLAANDVNGLLRLENNIVYGDGIRATLFGSAVTAKVAPAAEPGYRARLDVSGTITAQALHQAFDLPLADRISGETEWQGHLLLPSNLPDGPAGARAPLRLGIESQLVGTALDLPPPLAKPAEAGVPLALGLTVLPAGRFDIEGSLDEGRRFALSFASTDSGPQFRRGSVRLDGSYPLLPPDDGLVVDGSVAELPLDDWLALLRSQRTTGNADPVLSRVDLDVAAMSAFGQALGAATFSVHQGRDEWLIEIDSEPVAGHIVVPFSLRNRPQIVADMRHLHLSFVDDGVAAPIDPRDLPGILVNAGDFTVGQRRFGRLSANIQADPLGLRLVSYQSVGGSFAVEGSGSWLAGPNGSTTRFAFSMLSEDVAATLDDLGLQPIVEADELQVTASVSWPGGPSARWQQDISGDLSLHLDQGSMINLEPGAGRMWGLLSFTALPRRLALDFRDVFNRGLVFDEVAGDFVIVDGNAYTDNLLLTGPVADIGVVGRTGLRNEDYQQQAVVTAEPGKVLPTMGFLASPGIGAALLLFTRIFKEPLKGIGRASYCVSGDWDAPVVERLTPEQIEAGYLCADLPPSAATVADSVE